METKTHFARYKVLWAIHAALLSFLLVFEPQTVAGQSQCDLFADAPKVVGTISGVGHRECSGSASPSIGVTVRLKKDRWLWFDKTLASKSGNATPNIELTVTYSCQGTGSIKIYTEIVAGSKKAQSTRKNTSLCS